MSKRHARRIAKNRNASKPRWRKEGRALQRAVAQLTATLDEATKALEVSNARIAELLAERGAVVQSVVG